ncbi:hypothetical protein BU16DRAFT_560624 [Lophium mytilinum]|uniref:Uncharacterized protein n=1 Tax=Lophium mytilinum TaxID=390894 RepID=A0A6A6QV17_9PEZI|nr:hypothetical protein BU16DRAFT_560624 [Lophium mytilinum]
MFYSAKAGVPLDIHPSSFRSNVFAFSSPISTSRKPPNPPKQHLGPRMKAVVAARIHVLDRIDAGADSSKVQRLLHEIRNSSTVGTEGWRFEMVDLDKERATLAVVAELSRVEALMMKPGSKDTGKAFMEARDIVLRALAADRTLQCHPVLGLLAAKKWCNLVGVDRNIGPSGMQSWCERYIAWFKETVKYNIHLKEEDPTKSDPERIQVLKQELEDVEAGKLPGLSTLSLRYKLARTVHVEGTTMLFLWCTFYFALRFLLARGDTEGSTLADEHQSS